MSRDDLNLNLQQSLKGGGRKWIQRRLNKGSDREPPSPHWCAGCRLLWRERKDITQLGNDAPRRGGITDLCHARRSPTSNPFVWVANKVIVLVGPLGGDFWMAERRRNSSHPCACGPPQCLQHQYQDRKDGGGGGAETKFLAIPALTRGNGSSRQTRPLRRVWHNQGYGAGARLPPAAPIYTGSCTWAQREGRGEVRRWPKLCTQDWQVARSAKMDDVRDAFGSRMEADHAAIKVLRPDGPSLGYAGGGRRSL